MHDVAVIGAGPYGLSLAAQLADYGIDFRVFGLPMQTWRQNMPAGMRLKSEGFASSLYDAVGAFPLARYCQDEGIDYADTGVPVHLDTFTEYGLAFQRRFAPMLEPHQVSAVRQQGEGFTVELDTGETALFRRVVLATGIMPYAHMAEPFASLPAEIASHASARRDYSAFAGRTVAVVGGGASATDCAVALADAGAAVRIITRRPRLAFHNPPRQRAWRERLRHPMTTIGIGWKSVLLTRGPLVFRQMPVAFRHDVTRRHLGPANCWFTRERVEADIHLDAATTVTSARVRGSRVQLGVERAAGAPTIEVDHVVAATGYKVELDRLRFLDPSLRAQVQTVASTPALSPWFESSVPGLFFVGVSSANVFGPLVRFACGAEFTAGRLAPRLARTRRRAGLDRRQPRPRVGAVQDQA